MFRNMRQLMSRTRNRKKSKVKNKNQNPFMSPMLEFLSMPGNYFSNLQSSYASSSGSNGGSSNNILGGVTGLVANNPLTAGINGLIGDGSLSRKVTRTQFRLYSTLTLCSPLGLHHRADHLVQTRHLVPRLHRRLHRLRPTLHPDSRPGRGLRAPVQRDQRPGLLGLCGRVRAGRTQRWYWKYRLHQQTGTGSSILPLQDSDNTSKCKQLRLLHDK